jgi:hypothetical protein
MSEKPILFSAPMVRAILDGTKTETRRVVKWPAGCDEFWREDARPWLLGFGGGDYPDVSDGLIQVEDAPVLRVCPYGAPGDILWVRETWRPWSWHEGEPITVEFQAGGPRTECESDPAWAFRYEQWEERTWIALTEELEAKGVQTDDDGFYRWEGENPLRWRPSIHMPRWAARLFLRVTDVRLERVQDITEEGAIAEGVRGDEHDWADQPTPSMCFSALWDSLNAKRGYGWDANPWVWVYKFERTEVARG